MSDPVREHKSHEDLLWAYDVTAQLPTAATLASVTSASLTNTKTQALYPSGLSGGPSSSGSEVRQRVSGLVAGGRYRLEWVWVDSAGNTQVSGLILECSV